MVQGTISWGNYRVDTLGLQAAGFKLVPWSLRHWLRLSFELNYL